MSKLVVCDSEVTIRNVSQGIFTYQVPDCPDWRVIDSTQTELLVAGGFSPEAFAIGFMGVLGLWAVGLGSGLIVARIRKLRP